MTDRKLAPSNYRKLVADIVRIYDTACRSLVESRWKIGRHVVEIEQDGASRAAYGTGLLAQLSVDLTRERGLGFSERNLERMRAFYLEHRKATPASQLSWAHHQELLAVHEIKSRRLLEKRAEDQGLSRDQLRELIRARKGSRKSSGTRKPDRTPLVPKRGPLNIYKIRSGKDIGWPDPKALLLDHGFRFYTELPVDASRGLVAGDIVEVRDGRLVKMKDAVKPGYTYRAYLQKVIDGDTLWAALDTGLGGVAHQKLRFRGINCPEIKTPEGKAAKRFVESVLKAVIPLTVYSSKNDKYDRFEADVFFVDKNGQDVFLNNLLLEAGQAFRMDS